MLQLFHYRQVYAQVWAYLIMLQISWYFMNSHSILHDVQYYTHQYHERVLSPHPCQHLLFLFIQQPF